MTQAQEILQQISDPTTKLGDLRKLAKSLKTNHELAMELWASGEYSARQLALLILDKKQLTQEVIDVLDQDMQTYNESESTQLIDWLMANQLMKSKQTIVLMESWMDSDSPLQRRVFWYYQARLRWMGQTPPPNTAFLLEKIEERIVEEVPAVQWAMNFTAAQIGIFEEAYRARCIQLGEETGLYKDDFVSKNCTPNYLPLFIEMQVAKQRQ
ncbi:DNA alkylation repair protein [Enterococcus olivae]